MIILFPKKNGVKISTTLIFEMMEAGASEGYVLGAIDFAFSFGAITVSERDALIDYLLERG